MVITALEATNMFAVDVQEQQKVKALIRRRAESAASDQNLFFLSLHNTSFPDD